MEFPTPRPTGGLPEIKHLSMQPSFGIRETDEVDNITNRAATATPNND